MQTGWDGLVRLNAWWVVRTERGEEQHAAERKVGDANSQIQHFMDPTPQTRL